ncbi:hypothetical protein [Bacteroides sp. 519]|uniref:hypothetical protein n=1 Tax=Bacteroides sp. 519 TaxID=2302937 RepID=UPI0019403216|nr:hypothetical protein [Bacteroides sp. 519]
MNIQPPIQELELLGRMPDESNDNLTNEQIDLYSSLLDKVNKPINKNEAAILVKLFPESGLYGVQWTLLHLFESIYSTISVNEYRELIALCPSDEWRENLEIRLENGLKRLKRLDELSPSAIAQLKELGQIPDEPEDISEQYIDLLDSIKQPISLEEAKILIELFPNDNFNGVAWKLAYLFESVFHQIDLSVYKSLIEKCPSNEWKELLNNRMEKGLIK